MNFIDLIYQSPILGLTVLGMALITILGVVAILKGYK